MKKNLRSVLLSILVIATVAPIAPAEEAKWETLKQEAGITVQRRTVEGSNLVEFRGMGVVNGSVLEILSVLADTDNHPKWVANCIETKIVQQFSELDYIYYSSTDAPWPVTDRDFVSRAKVVVDEKNRSVTIYTKETTHSNAPERSDRVRMPFIRVTWYMKPMAKYKGTKTWLVFKVHADPGGWIPSWVANLASKKIPFESIVNLRARIREASISDEFIEKYKRFKDWY